MIRVTSTLREYTRLHMNGIRTWLTSSNTPGIVHVFLYTSVYEYVVIIHSTPERCNALLHGINMYGRIYAQQSTPTYIR